MGNHVTTVHTLYLWHGQDDPGEGQRPSDTQPEHEGGQGSRRRRRGDKLSLRLSDGTYFSRWLDFPEAETGTSLDPSVSTCRSLDEDKRRQKGGRGPDDTLYIPLESLSLEKMQNWWTHLDAREIKMYQEREELFADRNIETSLVPQLLLAGLTNPDILRRISDVPQIDDGDNDNKNGGDSDVKLVLLQPREIFKQMSYLVQGLEVDYPKLPRKPETKSIEVEPKVEECPPSNEEESKPVDEQQKSEDDDDMVRISPPPAFDEVNEEHETEVKEEDVTEVKEEDVTEVKPGSTSNLTSDVTSFTDDFGLLWITSEKETRTKSRSRKKKDRENKIQKLQLAPPDPSPPASPTLSGSLNFFLGELEWDAHEVLRRDLDEAREMMDEGSLTPAREKINGLISALLSTIDTKPTSTHFYLLHQAQSLLAQLEKLQGSYPAAIKMYTDVLESQKSLYGVNHPACFTTEFRLAHVLKLAKSYDPALQILNALYMKEQNALEQLGKNVNVGGGPWARPVVGESFLDKDRHMLRMLSCKRAIASIFLCQKEWARAVEVLDQLWDNSTTYLGTDSYEAHFTLGELGFALASSGNDKRALLLLEALYLRRLAVLGPDHERTRWTASNLRGLREKVRAEILNNAPQIQIQQQLQIQNGGSKNEGSESTRSMTRENSAGVNSTVFAPHQQNSVTVPVSNVEFGGDSTASGSKADESIPVSNNQKPSSLGESVAINSTPVMSSPLEVPETVESVSSKTSSTSTVTTASTPDSSETVISTSNLNEISASGATSNLSCFSTSTIPSNPNCHSTVPATSNLNLISTSTLNPNYLSTSNLNSLSTPTLNPNYLPTLAPTLNPNYISTSTSNLNNASTLTGASNPNYLPALASSWNHYFLPDDKWNPNKPPLLSPNPYLIPNVQPILNPTVLLNPFLTSNLTSALNLYPTSNLTSNLTTNLNPNPTPNLPSTSNLYPTSNLSSTLSLYPTSNSALASNSAPTSNLASDSNLAPTSNLAQLSNLAPASNQYPTSNLTATSNLAPTSNPYQTANLAPDLLPRNTAFPSNPNPIPNSFSTSNQPLDASTFCAVRNTLTTLNPSIYVVPPNNLAFPTKTTPPIEKAAPPPVESRIPISFETKEEIKEEPLIIPPLNNIGQSRTDPEGHHDLDSSSTSSGPESSPIPNDESLALQELSREIDWLKSKVIEKNLMMFGVPEDEGQPETFEETEAKAIDIIRSYGFFDFEIDVARRVGAIRRRSDGDNPRPIAVTMMKKKDIFRLLKAQSDARAAISGRGQGQDKFRNPFSARVMQVTMRPDRTPKQRGDIRCLIDFGQEFKTENPGANFFIRNDKLLIKYKGETLTYKLRGGRVVPFPGFDTKEEIKEEPLTTSPLNNIGQSRTDPEGHHDLDSSSTSSGPESSPPHFRRY